jgi:hypothetical protein
VVIKYGALPTQPFKFLPILLMSQLTNQAIIGGLYEAVNQRDFDYLAALGAPESEWFDVPYDFTDTGESAIVRPWKGWFDIRRPCSGPGHYAGHATRSVPLARW